MADSTAPSVYRLAGLVGAPNTHIRERTTPMTSFDDSNSTDAPPAPQKRSSPSGIAATFAIIAVFALFFGNLAFWIRQDVYDTATVIAKAQTITGTTDTQAAVTALFDETVVHPALEQATGTLPTILQGLAETAVEPVATVIDHAVASAVASQSAQEITTRLVKVINQELVSGTGSHQRNCWGYLPRHSPRTWSCQRWSTSPSHPDAARLSWPNAATCHSFGNT